MKKPTYTPKLKPIIFILSLLPLALLLWRLFTNNLGANPVEALTHETGNWTLRFLLITLTITPLRRLTKLNWLIKFRRMLGLFAFFYGCLHFATYFVFDLSLDLSGVMADIAKRPYITVGFLGFVLMIPLAVTSTRGMIRRLGKYWQPLHRLIYVSAIAGVVHYWWLVKADVRVPMIYAGILAVLLAVRVGYWLKRRMQSAKR